MSIIKLPIVSVLLVALMTCPVFAQWLEDGTPVLAEYGLQNKATMVSDGSGGAFIAGVDKRDPIDKIYVQRIDAYGHSLWTGNGILASDDVGNFDEPLLISDGAGGCYLAMSNGGIVVQHLDADGNLLWGTGGVLACALTGFQWSPTLVLNGSDGILLTWSDYRSGDNDIYAQKIAADGTVMWLANGVPVCTAVATQFSSQLISDESGGAIVAWVDDRSGTYTYYTQRIDPNGAPQWTLDGVAVTTSGYVHSADAALMPDGSGGLVIGLRESAYLYLQRMNPNGNRLWGDSGLRATPGLSVSQNLPQLLSDEAGGFFMCWEDQRGGSGSDIYGQNYDMDGTPLWTAGGVAITSAPGYQERVQMTGDDMGGFYATWHDDQAGDYDIGAQHMNSDGSFLLPVDGITVCGATGSQRYPRLDTDGEGGCIIVWNDQQSGALYNQSAIYAQRLERNGYLGYPAPTIATARDVQGDQGGEVFLAFDASQIDNWQETGITNYSVWRALDVAGQVIPELDPTTNKTLYWQKVLTLEAGYTQTYAGVVPTLFDSTATSLERHHFRVVAHGATPDLFWISQPDSCRSVDNLAPGAPQALLAMVAGPDIQLGWTAAGIDDEDLDHYNVYRSMIPGFIPDLSNYLFASPDTVAVDVSTGAGDFYYRVTAVDIHDNEGPMSDEVQATSVSQVENHHLPLATGLRGNHPNPFNPSTEIRFDLARSARIELNVYDVTGRLVKRLITGAELRAGRHAVRWDGMDANQQTLASGVYFYRMSADGAYDSGRMMLVK